VCITPREAPDFFKLLAFVQCAHHRAMHSLHQRLEIFDAVVDALGGEREVARLCDDQDTAAVCNWRRRRGRFPTKYYPVMKEKLDELRIEAPLDLWGFYLKKKSDA
jgi:hypothetical protein